MKKTKAFTMLEILFITLLLWIWLVSIFKTAKRAESANQRIVQSIIANQIATEWVEVLYQFRNTNFLKHQHRDVNWQLEWSNLSQRNWNKCRLALDYENIPNSCNDRLWSWYYYITGLNNITLCDDNDCKEHIATATGIIDNRYAICLTGWARTPCPEWHEAWWDQSPYWKFYRTIRGIWIYDMASDNTWGDLLLDDSAILAANAQEYRFCSMVARRGWENWEIEICSTMTNFIE